MMKSSEYWQKRFELLEQAAHQQGVQCYADIEKQYRQVQKTLEGQIAAWYQRFADNNGVTLADAKRMLTAKELAELKWDIQDYIRYGEENAINGTWVKQLENASARFHISRLEALKLQTQQSIEVMFGNQLDSIDSTMRDVYKSGYYHTAYEIQKGVGVGWDFSTLDDKQISKVINKPWAVDGKNFSERIWGNRQKLVNELNNTLTQNIILGKDPQKAIDEIAQKMNTSKVNAGRLVMTEEAFFSSVAQKDCFTELDVEMYEIVATLDSHTSDICRGMDGKHFKMSEWKVGETAPPFHVHCRSTTVPYFDDEFDAVGERAARDEETGKTYFVPGNMTYKEWDKAFVNGGDKSALKEATTDKYAGMSFMDKKEKIYTNEQEIEHLYEQKKNAELQILTGSSMADIEDGQKKATAATSRISELKTENETLQQFLGLPTNAKERFYDQNIDHSKLPCDVRESELGAVSSWTRTDYTFINQYLRNNDKGVRPESIQNAEILKKMIDRNVVSEPFTVKRGTDFTAMNRLFGSDTWKKEGYNVSGKIITDPGFFATTPDLHGGFGGGIQMYIDIPSGAKGVYLGDLSAAPDEKEFLLQCGTEFIVDRIEIQYNKWGEPLYDVYMKVKVK